MVTSTIACSVGGMTGVFVVVVVDVVVVRVVVVAAAVIGDDVWCSVEVVSCRFLSVVLAGSPPSMLTFAFAVVWCAVEVVSCRFLSVVLAGSPPSVLTFAVAVVVTASDWVDVSVTISEYNKAKHLFKEHNYTRLKQHAITHAYV